MDRTVPPGAAMLLDFIGDIEAPKGYGTIYANKQHKLAKPLTSMTLGDVVDAQPRWSKNHGSSAAGRYQFMRATLQDLSRELGLRGNQVLDPDLQDRLAYHLLKRRGYDAFIAGKIGRTEFGKRLAQEWASLPVLAATKGAHRQLKRGDTYYRGDGVNKVLITPAEVEAVLDRVKAPSKPAPVSAPSQPAKPPVAAPRPGTTYDGLEVHDAAKRNLFQIILDFFTKLFRKEIYHGSIYQNCASLRRRRDHWLRGRQSACGRS